MVAEWKVDCIPRRRREKIRRLQHGTRHVRAGRRQRRADAAESYRRSESRRVRAPFWRSIIVAAPAADRSIHARFLRTGVITKSKIWKQESIMSSLSALPIPSDWGSVAGVMAES